MLDEQGDKIQYVHQIELHMLRLVNANVVISVNKIMKGIIQGNVYHFRKKLRLNRVNYVNVKSLLTLIKNRHLN